MPLCTGTVIWGSKRNSMGHFNVQQTFMYIVYQLVHFNHNSNVADFSIFLYMPANNEDCGSPPKISQGELTGAALARYTTGSSVEYRCHSYHLMEGTKNVYCTRGTWSQLPKCLGRYCVYMYHHAIQF